MNLDNIFGPEEVFSTAELHVIAECLGNPTVKKYIRNEARSSAKAIASGLPMQGETADKYLLKQAQVVGNLAAFETLLDITLPTPSN